MKKVVNFSKFINKYLALVVLVTILASTSLAYAATTPTVVSTPATNLTNGQTVTITGSGWDTGSPGAILECNGDGFNTPSVQPTALADGNQIPVSCSPPQVISTDGSGNLPSTPFVVKTGTVGPPGTPVTEKDSAGNPANVDAAKFPCPPTAAQIAAGDSCIIAFGDFQNQSSSTNIAFGTTGGGGGNSHTNTTGGGGGTGGGTTQQSNNNSQQSNSSTASATSSSSSTLTNTGPGNVVFIAAMLAAAAGTVFYIRRSLRKARS
jgi:hypothetical protein